MDDTPVALQYTSRSVLGASEKGEKVSQVSVSQEGQKTKKIILNYLPFRTKNNEPFLGQAVTI